MTKNWNLSDALIEGRLEARVPGKMTGVLRLAGIIGDREVSVDIDGIPAAITGHGFVLSNQDPSCSDVDGFDVDVLSGDLEEFRWSVDANPSASNEDEEESWLDLDWQPAAEEPERGELHTLYLRFELPTGESITIESAVSKVILLRTRRAG